MIVVIDTTSNEITDNNEISQKFDCLFYWAGFY